MKDETSELSFTVSPGKNRDQKVTIETGYTSTSFV